MANKVLTEADVAIIGGTTTLYETRCCTKSRAEELGCQVISPSGAANNQLITQVSPLYNGYDYVDLGLPSGIKWAKCNIGASLETDYGNYYEYGRGSAQYITTYNDNNQYSGVEDPLDSSVDTAVQVMGGAWHMPTKDQCVELKNNTTQELTTINGVYGAKFTANNGNYIFLPACGVWWEGSQYAIGTTGCYWCSTPDGSNNAYYLDFPDYYSEVGITLGAQRKRGYSIRGVAY